MNALNCLVRKFMVSFAALISFIVFTHEVSGQEIQPNHVFPDYCQYIPRDTHEFHAIYARFQAEVDKRGFMDLDTTTYLGHKGLAEAIHSRYIKGLINCYSGLGISYQEKYRIDSAKYYYQLIIRQSEVCRDTFSLIKGHLGYGWALIYDHSDYEGTVENFQIARCLAEECGSYDWLVESHKKLAKIYYLKNDYWKAYEVGSTLVTLAEGASDLNTRVWAYYMLGSIFSAINLYDKQMGVVRKLLALEPYVKDQSSLYDIYNTAYKGFLNQMKYDTALYYSRKLIPMAPQLNKFPACYGTIAQIYFETHQLDSARYYYELMLGAQKSNETYIDIYEYLRLGKIEFATGNIDKAYEYLRQAEMNIKKPPLSTQKDIYKALYDLYTAKGDYKKSSGYLVKYSLMSDSITRYNNTFQAGLSIMELEASRLANQVELLTKDKELQVLIASKKAQKEKIIYGSLAIALLMAGMAFIRYKKQKNLKARQALLNERLRISRDLHDEVGSTLSGLALYTRLVSNQVKNAQEKEAQHSLNIMQNSASEMVNKLSDIVWLINPQRDTIAELFDRLAVYARQMASAKNMKVQIDLPKGLSNYHVPLEARRNIYLFCKESINNAVKYSNGTMIRLQVTSSIDKLRFSVSDDGVGFDEITVRRGNGLNNMRRRAEEIGGTLHIESKPNQGAKIALQYKFTQ